MYLLALRYNSDVDHTNSVLLVDGKYECDGLEDEYRKIKVPGETRIKDGIYPIRFRKVGGFHQRYLKRFGSYFHKGMLEICNVPNFKYVLIHILNTDKETDGCYGVGYANRNNANWICNSTIAYKKLYPKVRNALLRDEKVFIEFKTVDKIIL